jgi:hypothetical protein
MLHLSYRDQPVNVVYDTIAFVCVCEKPDKTHKYALWAESKSYKYVKAGGIYRHRLALKC